MRRLPVYLAALVLLLWSALAMAQPATTSTPDYAAWNDLANVAERIVETRTAENERLENLRESISKFRAQFDAARSVNSRRVEALREQIDALGPLPESGVEPENVAQRRSELNEELRTIQAPQQVADAAFFWADGLIREIDDTIREREARRLLSLGPSPLNPANWLPTLADLRRIFTVFIGSEKAALNDPETRSQLRGNLPIALLMLIGGATFLVKGRTWAEIAHAYLRRVGGRGTGVWGSLISLFRIFLPLAGLLLVTSGVRITGLLGQWGDQILGLLPLWGGFLLGFRWLAERLFARDEDIALIPLASEARKRARFYMLILSVMMVIRGIIQVLTSVVDIEPASTAVLAFPVVVVMGIALFGMGIVLRGYKVEGDETGEDAVRGVALARVLRTVGNGMLFVAVVAPVMAAIGYTEAGNALLYPTVLSLALMGFVLVLQRFFADVYALITRQGPEARDALVPALVGFLLVLVSLPFIALIWGARLTDLTELWEMFSRGFSVGDTRISPTDFIVFALIFGIGYTITRLIQSTLKVSVLPKTHIDIGGQNALVSGVGYVGIFLAALAAITGAGIDLTSLALVAGALSVGIGFGLRTIVENFVSGIILLIERPISEGDWIDVGGEMGYVRNISVRSTRIETFDKTDVIVPNANLVSGTVTNYTRGNTVGRLVMQVGVAYGTDTRLVDRVLSKIAKAQPMVLAKPPPSVVFSNFGADALEFELRMFLRDVNYILNVKSEVNHMIADAFAKEGIEVPFAQRDIWLRNPEALRQAISFKELEPDEPEEADTEDGGPGDKEAEA